MKKYEVTKTITLTVEPGSQVILSDNQYKFAKDCLTDIKNQLSDMTITELRNIAESKNIEISKSMTKAQIIQLLEKQV